MDKENKTQKGFSVFLLSIPWPWHVGLGVAAYLVLHSLAARVIPLPDQTPEEVALYTHRYVWKTVASIFQYVIPALFALLTVGSFRRSRRRKQ